MALPIAAPGRKHQHRRRIDVQIYSRDDGLWEVDARVDDVRTETVEFATGVLPAGQPIHDMLLRLVVDTKFNIVEAGAETLSMPYAGECQAYGDAYSRLAGLNLMKGFRRAVHERLGGIRGCTHINELAQVLPTAVVQAFAGQVLDVHGLDTKPFPIDRCQALRSDGEAVRLYFPRWYRPAAESSTTSDDAERARTP